MPCVSCVDGTQVAMIRPPEAHAVYPEHLFVNRHGYSSLNVQLVCLFNCLMCHFQITKTCSYLNFLFTIFFFSILDVRCRFTYNKC